MSLLSVLKPVTPDQALSAGATHHGYVFFMPVWVSQERGAVMAKWPPVDALIWLFATVSTTLFGGVSLWVGPKIGEEDGST